MGGVPLLQRWLELCLQKWVWRNGRAVVAFSLECGYLATLVLDLGGCQEGSTASFAPFSVQPHWPLLPMLLLLLGGEHATVFLRLGGWVLSSAGDCEGSGAEPRPGLPALGLKLFLEQGPQPGEESQCVLCGGSHYVLHAEALDLCDVLGSGPGVARLIPHLLLGS